MAHKLDKANKLDIYIATRIKELREYIGMTQTELGNEIGVSYQQIHKYETGVNRISAGRLGVISQALSIPIDYFYNKEEKPEYDINRLASEVEQHFRQIDNKRYQDALHLLIKNLAKSSASVKSE